MYTQRTRYLERAKQKQTDSRFSEIRKKFPPSGLLSDAPSATSRRRRSLRRASMAVAKNEPTVLKQAG